MDNPQEQLFPAPLLQDIQSRFAFVDRCPFLGSRTFLDSASGSLRLKEIGKIMEQQACIADQINRDTPGSRHVMDTISRGEDDVRTFLGSSGTVVAALTATAALSRTIRDAVAHFQGSNVVTTTLDHPATHDSLYRAAEVFGKEFRTADPCPATGTVQVDTILQEIDANTSVVALIHGSNVTGAYLDAASIVRQARKINEDICVIIDGVQYAPYAPVDVDEIGADVYVFAPYKTYCKKGIGFAVLSERFSHIPHDRVLEKPADDWSLGSADHINYAAWSAAVDYFAWLGGHFTGSSSRRERVTAAMSAIESNMTGLLDRAVNGSSAAEGLKTLEAVTLYGLEGSLTERTCVVPMNIRGMDAKEAAKIYMEQGVVVQARKSVMSSRQLRGMQIAEEGIVRLSAAHYTSPKSIDRFLQITAELTGGG